MKQSFAPGIKDRFVYGNTLDLPTDVVLTLARQLHTTRNGRRTHEDLRVGNESGLFSWALPKGIPTEEGQRRLAIRQPVHDFDYGRWEGEIKSGYGKGTVKLLENGPVVILKNTPDKIQWTRGTSQDSPIYTMIRTRNGNMIVTIKSKDQPTIVKTYRKGHFPFVPVDQIADIIDQGARVRAKIDGSSVLAYLGENGIRAFGTRVGANGMRPEYTSILGPEIRNAKVPKELVGRLIRGELYGVRNGKPIHPNELSGLLHSNLVNAIDTKQKRGIHLLIAALAENRNGVDDWYTGADDLVVKLNNPSIHAMPPVTGEAAKRLVDRIVAGNYPLTHEGAVLSLPNGKTYKSKKRDDYDVIVRDIFKADTNRGDMAGGFTYSYPGSDKIIGRVGTGFDDKTRRDMWEHPENWIGQTARVHSQEKLPSSALRAPGFIALKAD